MPLSRTTILIPTYNERENIRALVKEVLAAAPEAHIVVVDDNSPDGTAVLVREIAAKDSRVELLLRERKEGLGKAYLDAFAHVLAEPLVETIVMMDADFSHDPLHVPELLLARARADVVVGSRYVSRGSIVGWEWWRHLLSLVGNLYSRLVTGIPVTDLTAGFYAISADRLRRVLGREHFENSGYAFQIELKHRLYRSGATFFEVPITFRQRRGGESKISGHIIGEGIIAPWKMRFRK